MLIALSRFAHALTGQPSSRDFHELAPIPALEPCRRFLPFWLRRASCRSRRRSSGQHHPHLRAAEQSDMRIRYVIDTHLHADHVSAGRELAEAAGAKYVLFAEAKVAFPFHGVCDGDELELGNVTIRVLHTPGHTPEHISLLVTDRTRAEEPWFVLTGHTLMVGDLGRTELATSAEDGARALFRSV